eukprot:749481-Hanusia_phi.AAC.3
MQLLLPKKGAIKFGEGLDFLKDNMDRGTLYGWIGGEFEGLRPVAQDVGHGKRFERSPCQHVAGNHADVVVRTLKCWDRARESNDQRNGSWKGYADGHGGMYNSVDDVF